MGTRSEANPRILVFPYYPQNPWSDLLYGSLRDTGYEVLAPTELEQFEPIARSLGAGDVIHVQWLAAVVDGREPTRARERATRFEQLLRAAMERGVALVWTVHNVLSHDATNPELEIALARFLAATATTVHVLNPGTAAATSQLYELPADRTVLVEHSSYLGVYPARLSRDAARASFGLDAATVALLQFGPQRPYQGGEALRSALEQIGSSRFSLLSTTERVPDDDVARWFLAADLTVLPYADVLNSGTALLSATFGTPVLLPNRPALRALYADSDWVYWFEPETGPRRAIEEFARDDSVRDRALAFAAGRPPRIMADSFRALVEAARLAALDTER